jgi:hypothetical protein
MDKAVFGVFSGKVCEACLGEKNHKEKTVTDEMMKTSQTKKVKCKEVDGVAHSCSFNQGDDSKALYQVYGLGTGVILVTNTNGNIEVGDYICSSTLAGYGERQDDDLLHNYTVAKATEPVDWTKETKTTKLVACTYHVS